MALLNNSQQSEKERYAKYTNLYNINQNIMHIEKHKKEQTKSIICLKEKDLS